MKNITIGYLTSDLSTTYNCTIWQGLKEACEQRHVNFLYFSGGQLNALDSNQYPRNKVYDFITNSTVDGLIINATTIFHYVSTAEVDAFYKRFRDIPIVNLAMKTGNIPTVLVDNTAGIRDGLIHLIKDHGYERIAFIKGPGLNVESETRYDVYRQVLSEFGIREDPNLVETGNFVFEEAKTCLENLVKKNTHLDAVVAANDDMALGVLAKAGEMGILVPNELAVMGFDDIEDAQYCSVPLSTVRQPILGQARQAAAMIINLIEKKETAQDIVLPTEFVKRNSCGCLSNTIINARIPRQTERENLSLKDFKKNLTHTLPHISGKNQAVREAGKNPSAELTRAFLAHMEAGDNTHAISALDVVFNREIANPDVDIDRWQDELSKLVKAALPYIQADAGSLAKAESFWQQVRILIQKMASHAQSSSRMKNELKSAALRQISSELISNFDLGQLISTMYERLPLLGIESCYMSLYEHGHGQSGHSRLILGYNGSRQEQIPPNGIHYQTKNLLPSTLTTLDRLSNFIIEPLFFQEEQFGLIFFKTNPKTVLFEALRQQICGALKGALLVQDTIEKENMLKKLLKDQEKRSCELEQAYKALQDNQKKMLIIEKMASLGRMTAGIAHEINTPLAAVRACLLELESLTGEYQQSIDDAEVTAKDHHEIAGDMNKSIQISKKASEKIGRFVQSIKSQTRDMSPHEQRMFNAVPVIQDAVLLLNHELRKKNCPVNFTCSADPMELFGSGARLAQIITNLLTNAIDAYNGREGGPISIELSYGADGIDLTVTDKGIGIKKEIIQKIFDPMFTTKSLSEGTGLGLTIVHDIISVDFGGWVDVESMEGKGTTFFLHFPKPPKGVNYGQEI